MGNDQVSQVDRRVQVSVIPASTAGADPRSFQIQFRVHALPEVAEVYAWERYWDDPGVKPQAPVGQPPPDLAHSGIALGTRTG